MKLPIYFPVFKKSFDFQQLQHFFLVHLLGECCIPVLYLEQNIGMVTCYNNTVEQTN